MNVKVDLEHAGIEESKILEYQRRVNEIHDKLHENCNDEADFRGWIELPKNYDKEEFERIKQTAEKIRNKFDIFLVIGIGGSYLGARAVIEALTNGFRNYQEKPQIFYAGNNISSDYIDEMIKYISDKNFAINVISKSGTTTEPAIAFRIFRDILVEKYGEDEARNRIFVTTDKEKGALHDLAIKEKYETFVIPDNIGGRYSVLTAVGLLPIAVAGINIDELMDGAKFAAEKYLDKNLKYNGCYRYAVARNILYNNGKETEILVNYEPKLHYINEWWKQLFGESEGKEYKGLLPVGMDFTTDLHSLGQYVQQGKRNLIETVINVKKVQSEIIIGIDEKNIDGLNFLAGKTIDHVNKMAMEGTVAAHVSGEVPTIQISIDRLDANTLGHLLYFFEKSCAISGNILGVNPFNQPGVEAYKRNMFRLLGKFN